MVSEESLKLFDFVGFGKENSSKGQYTDVFNVGVHTRARTRSNIFEGHWNMGVWFILNVVHYCVSCAGGSRYFEIAAH